MDRVCNLVFHIFGELRVQILITKIKQKDRYHPLIFPISNGMFLYQSSPKELIDPNKDTIFIMELHNWIKLRENQQGVVWEAKNKSCIFR